MLEKQMSVIMPEVEEMRIAFKEVVLMKVVRV